MEKVILELKQCGVDILDYYYCPHHVDGIIENIKLHVIVESQGHR